MTTDTSTGTQKTDAIKEEGKHLTDEVKEKGGEIGRQAKEEIGHVFDDFRTKAKGQADDQTERAAGALRGVAGQLRSMAEGTTEQGMMVDVARDGADRVQRFADRLDQEGIDGIVHDIEDFARRRPGLFLAASVGVGMAVGRLFRATDMEGMKRAMGNGPDDGVGGTPVTRTTNRVPAGQPYSDRPEGMPFDEPEMGEGRI